MFEKGLLQPTDPRKKRLTERDKNVLAVSMEAIEGEFLQEERLMTADGMAECIIDGIWTISANILINKLVNLL